ncbi:hypothetical protein IC619_014475 [Hazenella sp. IB182353]|uniref:hypothetical protein n=1 Tax=Polycladospora coralii TaxID=2771432 RepID=UPI0017477A86|nr:hypothetical protein [Polycladospora coralii]MBS7531687.1 hypothetical protein [Polycladospora coralii]
MNRADTSRNIQVVNVASGEQNVCCGGTPPQIRGLLSLESGQFYIVVCRIQPSSVLYYVVTNGIPRQNLGTINLPLARCILFRPI